MQHYLKRRLHVSWHIAWFCFAFLVGVALAAIVPGSIFVGIQWLFLALAVFVFGLINRRTYIIILAVIAGVVLGLWRGAIEQNQLSAYQIYYDKQVVIKGKVTEDVTLGKKGDQQLRINEVQINQQSLNGQVWISTTSKAHIKRGDKVEFKGKLGQGFGNLPATMFYAKLVDAERPVPGDVALNVRDWFAEKVRLAIAEPQASLGVGYLVGQRSALPDDLNDQLQLLGLTHIVVASGYNLTIFVRLARQLFARISKYLATLAASSLILGFILITGLSPSMSRAGLIAGLSLAAWYYGRTIHPLVLLPFTAAITVVCNPFYIWGDIGWYLSFAAFIGVILLAPLITQFFWKDKKPGAVIRILIETTSAQVLTIPIIAYIFGQFAVLSVPANLLILPLIPITMLLTFVAGLVAAILPQIASLAGFPANIVLSYMTNIVNWLASVPWAGVEVEFGLIELIVGYVLIFLAMVLLKLKTKHSFKKDNIIE